MKLKSLVAILAIALSFSGIAFAQNGGGKRGGHSPEMKAKKEQLMEEKKTFINEKAGFTDKEAAEYWKIEIQKKEAFKATKADLPKGSFKFSKEDIEKLSDKEAEQKAMAKFDFQRKKIDIDEKFSKMQINAVGAKKFLLSENAEREFRQSIMKKMKEQGRGQQSQPAPAPEK